MNMKMNFFERCRFNKIKSKFIQTVKFAVGHELFMDDMWYKGGVDAPFEAIHTKGGSSPMETIAGKGQGLYLDDVRRDIVMAVREILMEEKPMIQHHLLFLLLNTPFGKLEDGKWFLLSMLQGYGIVAAYTAMLQYNCKVEYQNPPMYSIGNNRGPCVFGRIFMVPHSDRSHSPEKWRNPCHVFEIDTPAMSTLWDAVSLMNKRFKLGYIELMVMNRCTSRGWPLIRWLELMESMYSNPRKRSFINARSLLTKNVVNYDHYFIVNWVGYMSDLNGHCMSEYNVGVYNLLKYVLNARKCGDFNVLEENLREQRTICAIQYAGLEQVMSIK